VIALQGLVSAPYRVILHGTGNVEGTMRLVFAALGLTFILAAGVAQACPADVNTAQSGSAVVAQGGGSNAPMTRIRPQAQQQGG
jgi:hypothetical protein